MYSNSSHYQNHTDASAENLALPQKGFFTAISDRLTALSTRIGIERSRARYRARRAQPGQAGHGQDIVRSLPIEEKLRLGMYSFMD
jgi:hypothetical protein